MIVSRRLALPPGLTLNPEGEAIFEQLDPGLQRFVAQRAAPWQRAGGIMDGAAVLYFAELATSGPHVYNRRYAQPYPADAVYIGRTIARLRLPGTVWGNPYPLPHDATTTQRATVLRQFRAYAVERLRQEPDWLAPLRGRHLVCFCKPLACHGDILLNLANRCAWAEPQSVAPPP